MSRGKKRERIKVTEICEPSTLFRRKLVDSKQKNNMKLNK